MFIFVVMLSGEKFESLFFGGEDIFVLVVCVFGFYVELLNGCVVLCFYICGLGNIDFDFVVL